MITDDARNSRGFNVIFTCHSKGILHRHAMPLLLYPPNPIPYSQESDHSVTDGLSTTMLLIGTPLVATCWRNNIHSWRFWRCHSWSCCGLHCFPLFSKWFSWFKKYRSYGMTCAAWLRLPINDSSVSVYIFVEANAYFMSVVQAVCFSSGRNTLREWFFFLTLGMFCARLVVPPPLFYLTIVDHLVSAIMMDVVVGRVYGWLIEPHFLRDLSNICHWLLWWWCRWWIHSSNHYIHHNRWN